MEPGYEDWLRVVYGAGFGDGAAADRVNATEIAVRQSPSSLDPGGSPGGEQRVRVTVAPSEPGLCWTLYLRDFGPGPSEAPTSQVWWRIEPGTWQPLGGTRQCVAEGRGRTRLDVQLRAPIVAGSGGRPRLRFVAESG